MYMSPVHKVQPKPSRKAKWKEEEDKADKKEVVRQHQGMDRPGVRQVPQGSGEHIKMEEIDCEIISNAPTTLAVKGKVMLMMNIVSDLYKKDAELHKHQILTLK